MGPRELSGCHGGSGCSRQYSHCRLRLRRSSPVEWGTGEAQCQPRGELCALGSGNDARSLRAHTPGTIAEAPEAPRLYNITGAPGKPSPGLPLCPRRWRRPWAAAGTKALLDAVVATPEEMEEEAAEATQHPEALSPAGTGRDMRRACYCGSRVSSPPTFPASAACTPKSSTSTTAALKAQMVGHGTQHHGQHSATEDSSRKGF